MWLQLEIVYEEWGHHQNPVVLLFPSLSVGSHARCVPSGTSNPPILCLVPHTAKHVRS